MARLILLYIVSKVVKQKSQDIDLESSVHEILAILGKQGGGSDYKSIRKQFLDVATCNVTVGYTKKIGETNRKVVTENINFIQKTSFDHEKITDFIDGERPSNPDWAGHEFINTYLNKDIKVRSWNSTNILESVLNEINDVFQSLEAPDIKEEEKAKKGFFIVMMTWLGYGNVDLYVYEPDNTNVSPWNKKGNSGELDIDNRISFGPEHYYASCDSNKLQTGIYRVVVANYSGFGKECEKDDKRCIPPYRV